jgi:hypothetical protein
VTVDDALVPGTIRHTAFRTARVAGVPTVRKRTRGGAINDIQVERGLRSCDANHRQYNGSNNEPNFHFILLPRRSTPQPGAKSQDPGRADKIKFRVDLKAINARRV